MTINHENFRNEVMALLVKHGFVGKCEAIDDIVDVYPGGKIVITIHSAKVNWAAMFAYLEEPDELAEWI
jgi:hypothetical protein